MEIRTKITLQIWVTIAALLVIGLWFAWCSSSSDVNVPKANVQSNISANANANSVKAETEANTIAGEIKHAETNTNSARKEFKKAVTAARKPVKREKYEKIRNTPVTVDRNGVDARERKLLTKLRTLYWQQPK